MEKRGLPVSSGDDIPKLTKATLKTLELVPENIDEASRGADLVKRLLQLLGGLGNSVAELRGLYGTGHGKHADTATIGSKHAKLAVGCATTLVTFLFDTYQEQES